MKYKFLTIAILMTVYSCKDPCLNHDCHNGYCIDGDCFCEDGYYGDNCEKKESDIFIGNYLGDYFIDNHIQYVQVKILPVSNTPRNVLMNIDNSDEKISLRAKVGGDSIFIENQFIEKIDSIFNVTRWEYDTIINLIYPSFGLITLDSVLSLNLNINNVEGKLILKKKK